MLKISRIDDGIVVATAPDVLTAAHEILMHDGHMYEVRPDGDGGVELYISQFSRNSPCGGRPLVRAAIFGRNLDDIARRVVAAAHRWNLRVED